jgi:hypothetical protein
MITLFYSDEVEYKALYPLKSKFQDQGYEVNFSSDFNTPSKIGIYACHTNYFALSKSGGWQRPPCEFSVICLHDFYHDNGQRSNMFLNDSWHIFDLALVPGKRWLDIYQESLKSTIEGPRLGVREVGWPVSDAAFEDNNNEALKTLKESLGLNATKKTILLGASWQSRSMIDDCLSQVDFDKYNLIAKFFNWEKKEFGATPWHKIFKAQSNETKLAIEFAKNKNVIIVPFDINISQLLTCVDVVLSNGSNIMFEGLLQEVPSVCVKEWFHPRGNHGQFKHYPFIDMDGIVNGSRENLAALIDLAFFIKCSPIIKLAKKNLVSDENIGRGAELSVKAILEAYDNKVSVNQPSQSEQTKYLSELEILQTELLKDPEMHFDEENILDVKRKSDWLYKEKLRLEQESNLKKATFF